MSTLNMEVRVVVVVSALVALGAALPASAARDPEPSNRTAGSYSFRRPVETEWPWRLYAAFASGYGALSGDEFSRSAGGTQVQAGLALSYTSSRWVADAGLGWLYSRNSGADSSGRGLELRTRMGLLDLSARARIGERWSLGPVLKTGYGTDTSFTPDASSQGKLNSFAGARAVYELRVSSWPVRVYAEGLTDISISERTVNLVLAGFQIGLPFAIDHRPAEDRVVVASAHAATPEQREVRVVLDPQKVFFRKMSAGLKPEIFLLLTEVGGYLAADSAAWEEAEISGHADRRGRFEYNLRLSRERA
ncbi:MAG TPA: hypothetical protein VM598_04635, partial [Bdellovibrionota bacterium]|nr:hypothetical protein [Bdellovibrionota bacterium]